MMEEKVSTIQETKPSTKKLKSEFKNFTLTQSILHSKKLNDLLANYDEYFTTNTDSIIELCSLFDLNDQTDLDTYINKAKNRSNFLAAFFTDLESTKKVKDLPSLFDALSNLSSTQHIRNTVINKQEEIYKQLQTQFKFEHNLILHVENRKDGTKQIFVPLTAKHTEITSSQSSFRTVSSTDSNLNKEYLFLKTNVLFVYHADQIKTNGKRIAKLKEQIEKCNIKLSDFELSAKSDEELIAVIQKPSPMFLLFDKEINAIINENQNRSNDFKSNLYRKFYGLVYREYLASNNTNKNVYIFTLESFSEYKIENMGDANNKLTFRYKWLLRKLKEENDKKTFAKPYEIPMSYEKDDIDKLEKFLINFQKERLSPFL